MCSIATPLLSLNRSGVGDGSFEATLTPRQYAKIEAIFLACDTDGSGDVDIIELEQGLLNALGHTLDTSGRPFAAIGK